ncbi:alkanesulfonate monooxygenase SsuD/methylene tetrahydromethanopterin reductase-like flavin-dependent oxidoreductase (luciferase family) [Rhodoligotrophos appendicifer]|uniref:LLM class flavin-dependent oxidoreductase n=1 Tax=Rhodoligotrophos appendicifer TaxID=987056 RepID=UPI001478C2C3|nr:LLM class flavin-dependent oxidoreductase [Rhodoligotrophos appendicifer]
MQFGFYLPCYYPDLSYPAAQLYRDMIEEAKLAEELGFISLTIPEHHFINYLVHPSPLLTAVRVAAETKSIPLISAVLVLPFYDIRRLAGEIAQADCLTEGRIQIGVGRGAFRYEFDRFNVPVEESRERFDESLNILIKLLTEEEVGWDGKYYKFDPITIVPKPFQSPFPKIWVAALAEASINASVKRGFNVMTTPLRDPFEAASKQAHAFLNALPAGNPLNQKHSMLRMGFVTENEADTQNKLQLALENHRRFVNVFDTPGTVEGGAIIPLDVPETLEDIRKSLIIGSAQECVDKIAHYDALGIDDIQVNMDFGASHKDVMGALERFAVHVMPHFKTRAKTKAEAVL